MLLKEVDVRGMDSSQNLNHYEDMPVFMPAVRELRTEANQFTPKIGNRTVWMVNSTDKGGGVAEMMPKLIALLRELGVDARWMVIGADQQIFFDFTKRMHNLIHGSGGGEVTKEEKDSYEAINRRNADEMKQYIKKGDILVIHDPQPMAMGYYLKNEVEDISFVWRCHIGLDERTDATSTAWKFLRNYSDNIDKAIFSAPEYIPSYLTDRSMIIYPAIDPLSHKNRPLSAHKLTGILCNAKLTNSDHPVVTPEFPESAQRLQADGTFADANLPEDTGFLFRPVITEISRWDRLKGFFPLLQAFVKLKRMKDKAAAGTDERQKKRIDIIRLALAGPDPASIQDDPEGKEVLQEMCDYYTTLPPEIQKDISVLALPMGSRKNNALMVNAIQRCSTVVVQNSLREGFGLTVAEAMWKGIAPVGSSAVGIRQQIRDGIDGKLVKDPENPDEVAEALYNVLKDGTRRVEMGENAHRRCYSEFLIFTQVRKYIRMLSGVAAGL